MRKLIASVKLVVGAKIGSITSELLGAEDGVSQKKDANGQPTGEVERFLRLSCEIPKGNESFSRAQFDVKIPDGQRKFDDKELDEKELYVNFVDLEVSYIDNRNVYLKAADYEVVDMEEV